MLRPLLAALAVCSMIGMAHASVCRASWYSEGRYTATGERFNPDGLTAAHRNLPLGALLRVTYGNRSVVVRLNDRGPAAWTGRCLDLSRGSARALGILSAGVVTVHYEVM